MKVIHIIGGGDVGGAKVHVLSLVKELSSQIDVKIISLRHGQFAEDAAKMGIDVDVVKSTNIVKDIIQVIKIVKAFKCDIIHSHGAKANMFAVAVKLACKIPCVTTIHSDYKLDYMHSFAKKVTFGLMNAVALRYLDYYIAVSGNFKKMLIERGFDESLIFTLYNGLDFRTDLNSCTRSEFRTKFNIDIKDEDILVGIAARLYPVKGLDTLIEAASIVSRKNPAVKFLIGGDGEDRTSLERKSLQLGLNKNVFFLGWLDNPYDLMSIIDISVLTSISESFPYSILEGARFKKATISSDVGGIPDLIEHGRNGYLFKPGDYQKLACLIFELASDPEKRAIFGQKIYEKASAYFSLDSMRETQLKIYKNILKINSNKNLAKNKCDVIISGYYGFNNVGDDAMLKAIIQSMRKVNPGIKISVLSKKPVEASLNYDVPSIHRLNFISVYRTMKKAKLFIYGGGNILQDNTSTRSLMFYVATAWLAKKMNLKIMFYANGIGPLKKSSNIKRTKRILNCADVITVREELSMKELSKMGITTPHIELSADPALTLSPQYSFDTDKILEQEGLNEGNRYIGFSVRKCYGLDKKLQQNYENVIAQAAEYAYEKYGLIPVFIPMQKPIDIDSSLDIAKKIKVPAKVIKDVYGVDETLAIIKKMDLLVGTRLHSLVFALISDVPFSAIIYEPKIEGFLKHLGRSPAGHVSSIDFDTLKKDIDYTYHNIGKIVCMQKEKLPHLRDLAAKSTFIATKLLEER